MAHRPIKEHQVAGHPSEDIMRRGLAPYQPNKSYGWRKHKMAEPIANDWKAINARMQQIKAEDSGVIQSCPKCYNSGWIANFYGHRSYRVCNYCHNPTRLPKPAS